MNYDSILNWATSFEKQTKTANSQAMANHAFNGIDANRREALEAFNDWLTNKATDQEYAAISGAAGKATIDAIATGRLAGSAYNVKVVLEIGFEPAFGGDSKAKGMAMAAFEKAGQYLTRRFGPNMSRAASKTATDGMRVLQENGQEVASTFGPVRRAIQNLDL